MYQKQVRILILERRKIEGKKTLSGWALPNLQANSFGNALFNLMLPPLSLKYTLNSVIISGRSDFPVKVNKMGSIWNVLPEKASHIMFFDNLLWE